MIRHYCDSCGIEVDGKRTEYFQNVLKNPDETLVIKVSGETDLGLTDLWYPPIEIKVDICPLCLVKAITAGVKNND